jgi:AraC-like DNA-binding protein
MLKNRVSDEIKELLKLKVSPIHPDFLVFMLDEVGDFVAEATFLQSNFFGISIAEYDEGVLRIGDVLCDKLESTLSFLSPGQFMSYQNKANASRPKGLNVIFKASFLNPHKKDFHIQNEYQFFKRHTFPIFYLNQEQLQMLLPIFEEMYKEQDINDENSIPLLQSLLHLLLNKLNRITGSKLKQLTETRKELIAHNFEVLVIRYVLQRWPVSQFAKELNISHIYLSDCVKSVTGKTPKEIITDYQVFAAKSLLSQTQKSINEVAYEMGFDELTNFTKFFKKNVSLSPKAFRKSLL